MTTFIWLKRRKRLEASEEEKIKNTYNSLSQESQKSVIKKANTQIGAFIAIAAIVLLGFMAALIVAFVTKEGIYEKVICGVGFVLGIYMLICDLTWVKASNHEKMMLVLEFVNALSKKQDQDETK